ncbi:DciA family protein [Streptomyces sp. NPDC006551]|uniref:DciA family protein n=1 Tax=Streptomyces sp. NPDC006551 TaxID=3157178 RepID=UPI0033BA6C36
MSDPQPKASGADLARQALAAYKTGRRPSTGHAQPVRRRTRRHQSDGRDPVGFGALLANLGAEQGWATGVQGGSILDRWTELCPQYEGRVQAVAFDAARGRLDLRPGSDAYAAQLRLLGGQLCRQINEKLGTDTVRSIRILPVGHVTATAGGAPDDTAPVTPPAPPRTRETASAGYRRVLAIHQEHRRTPDDSPLVPLVAAARARQDAALLAHRLPDEEHTEYLAERERLTQGQPVDSLAASVQAARRYTRTSRTTGDATGPRQVFGAA